jgi:ribosomal protein S18 acetylase RimI-like enzyme
VTAFDEEFLLGVYASTREAELANVGWDDAQIRAFVSMQHRAQSADYRERFPKADYSVIVLSGRPIGRLWVDRHTDEIRILDVTVLPRHQGQGVGTLLIKELQAEARHADVPLRDSVLINNPRAEALYRRLGFVQIGENGMYRSMEWAAEP